jgi:alkylation response protein AidB-like acyl-CoA dehydrogenase
VPPTSEQRALRAAVRAVLAGHRPGADGSERIWSRLAAEIGVAGLTIPERFGGAGAGLSEAGVVQEELGRSLASTPMLGSAVLGTQLLLQSGDEAACARLLPGLADGSQVAAVAWTTAPGRWDPAEVACQATAGPDGAWSTDGTAHFVLDGARATVLLVPVRTANGTGLLEVRPGQAGVTVTGCTTVDETRPLATVRFAGALGVRIGAHAALAGARDMAAIALAAEQAGAAARALEVTVGYTKTRVQFGRPIGSFQALQHRMADLHVLVQSATSLVRAAAAAADRGEPGLELRAAAAKVYCSDALSAIAAEMIQLHGAIAMTWEHEAHRFFKRAHGSAWLLGSPGAHVARIAAAVIDPS